MTMTAADFQEMIYKETGIKTSVKKLNGSMKNYIQISPMFQDGKYPTFPFDFVCQLKALYPGKDPNPNFFSISNFSIYGLTTDNAIKYKREAKPKTAEDTASPKWGSKNSHVRLDKACRRYAKRMKQGNCAIYS